MLAVKEGSVLPEWGTASRKALNDLNVYGKHLLANSGHKRKATKRMLNWYEDTLIAIVNAGGPNKIKKVEDLMEKFKRVNRL